MITEGEAVQAVQEALARAVSGDMHGGAELLIPLITDSCGSAYALAAMLAETAASITRRDLGRGHFGIAVAHERTGAPASTDDLPPDVAFATRFTAAWANRDQDTAEALLLALMNRTGPDGAELVEGLLALFQLAVFTAAALVEEQRGATPRSREESAE